MQFICVRHGRTAWNAVRRFQGQTDIPLDEEGRAQAQALAAYLGREHFDIAIASDLSRAFETARAIGDAAGVAIQPEPRLREMLFGAWEGLTWDEIVALTPSLAYEYEKSPRYYVPERGESFDDLCVRVAPVLADTAARLGPDGRALIVSHAGVMHALLRVALDEADEAALGIKFVPAGIMRLEGDGRIPWRLASVNEVAPPLAESPSSVP
ncbi:MAG: histidine phosphatase family protein [Candidatus Velthaea sp.]